MPVIEPIRLLDIFATFWTHHLLSYLHLPIIVQSGTKMQVEFPNYVHTQSLGFHVYPSKLNGCRSRIWMSFNPLCADVL